MRFEDAIRLLHDGRINFNEFYRETKPSWERLARYLLRRWKAPKWVEVEEIVQELIIGAWNAVWCYSEFLARGVPLANYVQWNAVDKAKKSLHKMRGAKLSGNADANPSNFETPLSSFEATSEWLDGLLNQEADQHDLTERKERVEKACRTEAERRAMRALSETGDIIQGAILLFEDDEARALCGLHTARDAGRFVASTAFAVAQRLGRAAA
jgi:DNA-directed RNA polymerase specialized sigma24 family protein